MKNLNTIPIEDFLDRTRVAIKSNQKTVTLTIKEATDLQNSLSVVMTRLAGDLDQIVSTTASADPISIKMDGGSF
jgi:hypothetical protein